MSRHPSPGPGPMNVGSSSSQMGRMQFKAKGPTGGLTQGAEDAKYHQKYKELKRKVKEIETDNDKLHYKVLQAKRNIQRMKLERAILYERLAAVPPSPEPQDRPLPAVQQAYHVPPSMEADPGFVDYMRAHPTARGPPPADGPGDPYLRAPRRDSASDARLMGPGPMQPPSSHTRAHSHASPPAPKYPSAARPMYDRMPYPEPIPPMHASPPDRDRGRRHELHDLAIPHERPHERPHSPHSESRSSSAKRSHNHQRMGPGTYVNRDDHRDRTRDIELERERDWEMRAERDRREISLSRTRELPPGPGHIRSPPTVHRSSRHDYADPRDQGYYHDMPGPSGSVPPGYAMHSRSETPGSGSGGSGSNGPLMPPGAEHPSRPDSREQYYDHDRPPRSYRLRPVSQQQQHEDLDFVHEDGRSQGGGGGVFNGGDGVFTSSTELGRSSSRIDAATRKRRDDMMDMDDGAGIMYPGQDRPSKRYPPRRDDDDDRMG